ncbi:MAG: ribulose bisphosphate carboxylase small subunit [Cyanobacteria bacterium J06614_10]
MVARGLSQVENQSASQDAGRSPSQGPTPAFSRLTLSANPTVSPSADVHDFCLVEGDVRIGAGTVVAPGTAVTASSGASVQVGDRCYLLPGVVVEGVAGARVTGAAGTYSVYIGDRSIIAHKSLVHGPAFIGADCFIGFRSTVFNARLGDGCVVMMHALVQDVEVPPGRCVPSGSIITAQHQADQLPKVRPEDLEFAKEVVGASAYAFIHSGANGRDRQSSGQLSGQSSGQSSGNYSRSGSGYGAASRQSGARLKPVHSSTQSSADSFRRTRPLPSATEGANMQAQRLSPEIVQQVRQFLAQGYRIGMEHADKRRYRSGVWETCTPIKDTREQAVFAALEQCLAEHSGEYVRMFGIDQRVKRRVGMVTVQRPDGKPVSIDSKPMASADSRNNGGGYYSASNNGYSSSNGNGSTAGGLTPAIMQEVSNLLRGGYIIGTEHADPRRYRSNVWKSCSPIDSTREQEVFSRLQHCLEEHSGEYVRMFGIDPQAKRRVSSTTIQRADGKPVEISSRSVAPASGGAQAGQSGGQSYSGGAQSAGVGNWSSGNSAAAEAAGQILRQGAQIGIEFADARRYRSGIWQTAPKANSAGELQKFLSANADKYVRIFSVNTAQKTRGAATTIHKPGQAQAPAAKASTNGAQAARGPIYNNPPHYDDPPNQAVGAVESDVMDQVTQLVNQGFRISIEFADKRRFRSGIWQTGEAITARRPAEVISALGKQLARHQGDYVRLVGVDPQAKRRVLEATIQRP